MPYNYITEAVEVTNVQLPYFELTWKDYIHRFGNYTERKYYYTTEERESIIEWIENHKHIVK